MSDRQKPVWSRRWKQETAFPKESNRPQMNGLIGLVMGGGRYKDKTEGKGGLQLNFLGIWIINSVPLPGVDTQSKVPLWRSTIIW